MIYARTLYYEFDWRIRIKIEVMHLEETWFMETGSVASVAEGEAALGEELEESPDDIVINDKLYWYQGNRYFIFKIWNTESQNNRT